MKKLLAFVLVLVFGFSSMASAVILASANASKQAGWALTMVGIQDTDDSNDLVHFSYGPTVTYGITDRLSITGIFVMGNSTGDGLTVDLGFTSGDLKVTQTGYQVGLNFNLLDDLTKGNPFSFSVSAYYTGATVKTDVPSNLEGIVPGLADSTDNVSAGDLRLIFSKIIIPLIPYAGFKYGSQRVGSQDSSWTEMILGTGLLLSQNFSLLAEYVSKNTNTAGSNNWSYELGVNIDYLF